MSWSVERGPGLLLVAAVIFLVMAVVAATGGSRPDALTGGPHYFETAEVASGGRIPIIPKGRITESDARARQVYGVATFDSRGRLASYETVKDGQRVWMSKLSYSGNGTLRDETYEGPSGGVILWQYDNDGRFVGSKMVKAPR